MNAPPLLAGARTYPPPHTVVAAVRRGLELPGSTVAPGIETARHLVDGHGVDEAVLRRLHAYFDAHPGPDPSPAGRVGWLLAGGESGRAWVRRMVARLDSEGLRAATAAACPEGDCTDTGWYGLEDPEMPDLLIGLVRDVNRTGSFEHLTAAGWQPFDADAELVLLNEDVALDLAGALAEGCVGLLRRPTMPVAWIEGVVSAMEVSATPIGLGEQRALSVTTTSPVPPDDPYTPSGGAIDNYGAGVNADHVNEDEKDWHYYAVVDDLDTNAVLEVIRIAPGPELQRYDHGNWIADDKMLTQLLGVDPPTLVELDESQLQAVLAQVDSNAQTPQPPGGQEAPAVAALVADKPPTVSPNPNATRLRSYWSHGKGAAKIRWGTPGDFTRCVRQLRKYLGVRAKGYCANLHKISTGVWPGDKRNPGRHGSIVVSAGMLLDAPESELSDAVIAAAWSYDPHVEAVDMMLRDGIYTETADDSVVASLVAGAFPLRPPSVWFEEPKLAGPTPIEVDDNGQVRGHIATFDVAHIGLPGKVHAPRSRANYAYFKTGVVRTNEGKDVPVGQITLAGGHAPLSADAGAAVEHYDNTASAVADVNVGHDRWGIWVAGAVRPEATPEQVRALRASAPSGDWRPINGALELVAICQVNVPGFPVARARVASGVVTSLVAAGAMPLAKLRLSMLADAAVADRLSLLEQTVFAGLALEDTLPEVEPEEPETAPEPDTDPAPEPEPAPAEEPAPVEEDKVAKARAYIRERRRQALRERVHAVH